MITQVFSAVIASVILVKIGLSIETELADAAVLITAILSTLPKKEDLRAPSDSKKLEELENKISKLNLAFGMTPRR